MTAISKKVFLPLVLLGGLSFQAQAQGVCQNLFPTEPLVKGELIYPKGVAHKEGNHFQISYEAEYLFSESGALLRDYAPDASIMSVEQWLEKTDQQRIDWIKSQFGDKPEYATAAGLKRIVNVDFLPEELIVDSTGNLEIVINPPLNSFSEWSQVVKYITEKYGAGSQQAMLSKPRESAFVLTTHAEQLKDQHFGWLNFTHLYDVYEKLESGFERYELDNTKLTAQFFDHPFLGPMTKLKRDVLESYLDANAHLEKYDDESKQFVRKNDSSFKYTGGPSYRPDIAGPVRWAWEIRNAHKDTKGLIAKVQRDIMNHTHGLEDFEVYAKIPAFDTVAEFDKLGTTTQELLKTIFPSKADPRFDYSDNDRLALETYRNFSMPMMDMAPLIKALTKGTNADITQLTQKAAKARVEYFDGLNRLEADLKAQTVTKEQAKARAMGLLVTWSQKSGLTFLFKEQAARMSLKQFKAAEKAKQAG